MGALITMADVTATVGETFATSLSSIKSDCMTYIAQALPLGLTVMGTILAITIGVKAFKRFSH